MEQMVSQNAFLVLKGQAALDRLSQSESSMHS